MCKLMSWNLINLIRAQLAQCSLPLPHSELHLYYPDTHFPESHLSIHHKLPYKQHSLQDHSEGESLPPPYVHCMLIRTKEWRHPEEPNMVSKYKHTKDDGQQTNAGQYPFIALLFHIQENGNTVLTASKHNTFTCLLQERCSFYWHNTLMHKMSQKMSITWHVSTKQRSEWDILCFQRKFNYGPYSNSATKLPIQPSELITKHAHKCPICNAHHLPEKTLQP